MNSFILIANDLQKSEDYLLSFSKERHISPFDQKVIDEEGSIGIEVVRNMQKHMFVKPYKGDAKMVSIKRAENLTIEAQNALLKILEEPPSYVFLFLCATTDETFLPTILSRCQLIKFAAEKKGVTDEERETLANQLDVILHGTIHDKLSLAEKLAADKENLSTWFDKIILYTREKMLKNLKEMTFSTALLSLSEANKTTKTTNVNARAVLEHAFLQI